jgi:hypothetical protein
MDLEFPEAFPVLADWGPQFGSYPLAVLIQCHAIRFVLFRKGHERFPVLHHHQEDLLAGREARCVWQGEMSQCFACLVLVTSCYGRVVYILQNTPPFMLYVWGEVGIRVMKSSLRFLLLAQILLGTEWCWCPYTCRYRLNIFIVIFTSYLPLFLSVVMQLLI